MQRVLAYSISALVLILATSASADNQQAERNKQLKGQYAVTGSANCLNVNSQTSSPTGVEPLGGGFDPATYEAICQDTGLPIGKKADGTPNPSSGPGARNTCLGVIASSYSVQGIRTFNGDGTGTINVTTIGVNIPPNTGSQGGSSLTFKAHFTYQVDADGGVTTYLVSDPATQDSQITSGLRAGETVTHDKLTLYGMIGQDAKSLTLASGIPPVGTPEIERRDFTGGPLGANHLIQYRVCDRSRVLIKINDHRDNDTGGDKH
jgi:hypothetical protein